MKFQRHDLKLFTGNANPELAAKISDYLGVGLSRTKIDHFADGEIDVQILDSVRDADCYNQTLPIIEELLSNQAKQAEMQNAIAKMAVRGAADKIVDQIDKIVNSNR